MPKHATQQERKPTPPDRRANPVSSALYTAIRTLHLIGMMAALPLTIGFLHAGGADVLDGWRLVAFILSACFTALFNLAIDQATYPTHLLPALHSTTALYVNFAANMWLSRGGLYYGAYVGWLGLLVTLGIVLGGITATGLSSSAGIRNASNNVWEHEGKGLQGLMGGLAGLALVGAIACASPFYRQLTALTPLQFVLSLGTFVYAVAMTTRTWWQTTIFSKRRKDADRQESEKIFETQWAEATALAYVVTVVGALIFVVWPTL